VPTFRSDSVKPLRKLNLRFAPDQPFKRGAMVTVWHKDSLAIAVGSLAARLNNKRHQLAKPRHRHAACVNRLL
jgi:hypothetical protein